MESTWLIKAMMQTTAIAISVETVVWIVRPSVWLMLSLTNSKRGLVLP